MNLDFELPVCNKLPLLPPRMDNDTYVEFIELNLSMAKENGTAEQLVMSRPRPVEAFFVLN